MGVMGHYVDGPKFVSGSFSYMPEKSLRELIDIAQANDVYVSTVRGSCTGVVTLADGI